MNGDLGSFSFWIDKLLAVFIGAAALWTFWRGRLDFRVRLAFCACAAYLILLFVFRLILFFGFGDLLSFPDSWEVMTGLVQGLRFDLCVLGAWGSLFVLAFLCPFPTKRHYQIVAGLCACAWSGAAAVCAGDLIYFSFVKRHTGSEILLAVYDMDLLVSLVSSRYVWAALALAVFAALAVWGAVYTAGRWYRPVKLSWKTDAARLFLAALLLFFAFRGHFGFRFKPLSVSDAYAEGNITQGNLALNGPFCIYKSLFGQSDGVSDLIGSEEAAVRARELLSSGQTAFVSQTYPLLRARKAFNADGKGYNIVILLLESWQYRYTDAFSDSSYGATPHLDALARSGRMFDRFYASGQRSINGAGAVMTGVAQVQGLPCFSLGLEAYRFTGLAALLHAAGYRTVFAQPSDWNSARIGLVARLAGFGEIYSKKDLAPRLDYIRPDTVSDYDALMLLADKLKGEKRPFLAFFFSAAMHPPYNLLHKEFSRYDWNAADKGYLNALNYTDWSIGQFIKRLKEQGQYERTVFIVLADHTLGWGEHGGFDDRFHIPMFIHAPNLLPPGRDETPASQTDILPTVLDLLGIGLPYAAMGNSVLDPSAPHFAFTSMDGRVLGWAESGGYLEHTGQTRAGGTLTGATAYRNLLALNRAVYDALTANHWAPR